MNDKWLGASASEAWLFQFFLFQLGFLQFQVLSILYITTYILGIYKTLERHMESSFLIGT